MDPVQRQVSSSSSGSEGARRVMTDEERKLKRKISNRESAQRSRMKKQQQLEEALTQVKNLREQNNAIHEQISKFSGLCDNVESQNGVLRYQRKDLTDRLRALNDVLYVAEVVTGSSLDIPEIPNALLKPWQLPCPSQPMVASVDVMPSAFGIGGR